MEFRQTGGSRGLTPEITDPSQIKGTRYRAKPVGMGRDDKLKKELPDVPSWAKSARSAVEKAREFMLEDARKRLAISEGAEEDVVSGEVEKGGDETVTSKSILSVAEMGSVVVDKDLLDKGEVALSDELEPSKKRVSTLDEKPEIVGISTESSTNKESKVNSLGVTLSEHKDTFFWGILQRENAMVQKSKEQTSSVLMI